MKLLKKCPIFVVISVLIFATVLFAGSYTQNGIPVGEPFPEASGQVNYYAIPSGTGDCTSWDTACSFRTAVAKCPGTKLCVVYVGAGLHDLNNGADVNGTTIDKDYVRIQGLHVDGNNGQASQLMNSRATVDYILRVTGDRFVISGIAFDNSAQTDKNITMLNIRGSYSVVSDCIFRQATGDPGGTGILADNGAESLIVNNTIFKQVVTYGFNIGDFTCVQIKDALFFGCGTGIYLSHANAGAIVTDHAEFYGNTTALNLVTGQANQQYYVHPTFANNTTNFTDLSAYGGAIWFEDVMESGLHRAVYPTGAGTAVAKDADAWTWGGYVDLIAAGTIKKPFKIQSIILQDWSAAQVFKIELFYDDATPGIISLGVFEMLLGDPATKSKVNTPVSIDAYVPAYATVGAKLMSSTAGVDSITITLGYELL